MALGLMDMIGSLGQFEEYGKALVEFQKQVLASLSRIEAEQARAAEERGAIMAKLDHMVNRLDQQI